MPAARVMRLWIGAATLIGAAVIGLPALAAHAAPSAPAAPSALSAPSAAAPHGANSSGPYDATSSGASAGNGAGSGAAVGKPCAGCVGNADDKNPPGQLPNGSDSNAGYECDRNQGIGQQNPAHTGCQPSGGSITAATQPAVSSDAIDAPGSLDVSAPDASSLGVGAVSASPPAASDRHSSSLAVTGAPLASTLATAAALAMLGGVLLLLGRRIYHGTHRR